MLAIRFLAVFMVMFGIHDVVAPGLDGIECLIYGVGGAVLQDVVVPDNLRDAKSACNDAKCTPNGECVTFKQNGVLKTKCLCKEGYSGDKCQTSTDETRENCPCSIVNSVCVEKRCVCRSGYFYYPVASKCIQECPEGTELGNTFTEYPDSELNGFNLVAIPNIDLDSCKAACLENPVCRSITLDAGSNRCVLQFGGRDDDFMESDNGNTYAQRDCVQK